MDPELEDGAAADAAADAAPVVDILAMSDEDFLKQLPPGAASEPTAEAEAAPAAAAGGEAVVPPVAEGEGEKTVEPVVVADKVEPTPTAGVAAAPVVEPKPVEVAPVTPTPTVEAKPVDYEAFYKTVMSPLKANGKTIELKDPSEAVALMQMGANYTRKMQELAPQRKLLTMVQNAGLDEDKLSYLIDLDKKDPEAIKKLIKDAGIDPNDIDTTSEPAYLAGNHRVSDEEVNLQSALDGLRSSPAGVETLNLVNANWDQASKQALWDSPQILAIIHDQRESGIYGRIAQEVDRQQTLGKIPAGTPFLQAYRSVGDDMKASGAFNDLILAAGGQIATAEPAPAPVVVATTVAQVKPAVTADDRAAAAGATRSSPKPAQELQNPLAMSDEEFLKHFNGRL